MSEAKPFAISKRLVWQAYKQVRAKKGAAGVDRQSLEAFEADLEGNLYKIWNRLSSGSYMPPPVKCVDIPKPGGGVRSLGIPTVADRIAQSVVRAVLEPKVEPVFHPDSYGYRPGKSARDAVATARKRCWRSDWVIDLDIASFFDTIPHQLIEQAVAHHTDQRWVRLYVSRWLQAPIQTADGRLHSRDQGTPQGSVISPLLANLFMHYAFDRWMQRTFPTIPFERYADDALVHCKSEKQARFVLTEIAKRLGECGLKLHATKTKIVYCKDTFRTGEHEVISFDFLGYTFRPRAARSAKGVFTSFLPAISNHAQLAIRERIREWDLSGRYQRESIDDLLAWIDPIVRGWINYYGAFYRTECLKALQYLNWRLVRWIQRKHKRYRSSRRAAWAYLQRIARQEPQRLALWEAGYVG